MVFGFGFFFFVMLTSLIPYPNDTMKVFLFLFLESHTLISAKLSVSVPKRYRSLGLTLSTNKPIF